MARRVLPCTGATLGLLWSKDGKSPIPGRQLNLPAGEQAVEVPTWPLSEALDSCCALQWTDHETVIVAGTLVTDPDALPQLRLPANERAIEAPPTFLARVLQAC